MRSSIISCVAVILLGENADAFSSSSSVSQRRGVSLHAHKTSTSCDRSAFLRTSLATTIASVTAVLSPTIAFADEDLTMPTAEEQKATDVSCDVCLDTNAI